MLLHDAPGGCPRVPRGAHEFRLAPRALADSLTPELNLEWPCPTPPALSELRTTTEFFPLCCLPTETEAAALLSTDQMW